MSKANLRDVFRSDPEVMGGTPVFTGTRVPVQNRVDYLERGETIDDFLAAFIKAAKEKLPTAA